MFVHEPFKGIAAEFGATDGREQRIIDSSFSFTEPDVQNLERILSQRRTSLFSSLALAANMGSCPGHDVAAAQVDDLRRPQASLQNHDEKGVVATSGPGGSVGRGQQGVHFRTIQELDRSPDMAFAWQGQDP